MNKLVKGSIAGAAGIALLLGGAGTLAYWNDSQTLASAGSISSGQLDITAATGSWDKTIAKIVPGDSLTYTGNLSLAVAGDNLKFSVSDNVATLVSAGSITGATVTPTVVVQNASQVVQTPTAGVYKLPAGTYTIKATVAVDFPTSVSGLTGQNQTLNLSTAAVTVQQVQ
ncbi:alternate signal-mediated exported protein [Homoserinimonas aerilata]|uniref:Alternate signal-mediated exported protein n=1 Tax=Homoserinimonas aerilata TaxID=1162970 RepID=A0A542YHR5_9MICO|nr:alternate-type signal peptide domain-containing protein [Homoserinimonas aerilata]TQL47640.1 alternate signal-mediated exported protein [Homoserinimonas aerilata]